MCLLHIANEGIVRWFIILADCHYNLCIRQWYHTVTTSGVTHVMSVIPPLAWHMWCHCDHLWCDMCNVSMTTSGVTHVMSVWPPLKWPMWCQYDHLRCDTCDVSMTTSGVTHVMSSISDHLHHSTEAYRNLNALQCSEMFPGHNIYSPSDAPLAISKILLFVVLCMFNGKNHGTQAWIAKQWYRTTWVYFV